MYMYKGHSFTHDYTHCCELRVALPLLVGAVAGPRVPVDVRPSPLDHPGRLEGGGGGGGGASRTSGCRPGEGREEGERLCGIRRLWGESMKDKGRG